MNLVVEREQATAQTAEPLRLYVVWIDTNMGDPISDWEMNSDPQPLQSALQEAREAREAGFPAKVVLEGLTPRPDGLFSNPDI